MNTSFPFNWRCPSCHERLSMANKQWCCAKLHSFDMAKEGYVNLLLAQHKNSKDPGDNKDMVNARRAFLAQDHYLPLANTIADLLHQHFSKDGTDSTIFSLFDAGCGEGYYLDKITNNILNQYSDTNKPSIVASGIDISKPAIQKAAKKYKSTDRYNVHFAVGSCFDLPVTDQSQHAIIQIFAPATSDEMLRVLQSQGIWVKVSPASDHLYELKSMVYDNPAKHDLDDTIPAEFSLLSQQALRFNISLSNLSDRQNLLMMTPFYWTISEEKKQKLLADLHLTQAHFDVRIFQKNH